MVVERMMVKRRTRVEARLEIPRVKVPLRLRRLRRRPVVLGDVDLEALTGGVVFVAVDALEGPVVVDVVELVLAAVHVRLQVSLRRRHVGALWQGKRWCYSVRQVKCSQLQIPGGSAIPLASWRRGSG